MGINGYSEISQKEVEAGSTVCEWREPPEKRGMKL